MPVMMPAPGAFVVVHPVGRQRGDFEQRATGVKQPVDAIPGQQLASVDMAGPERSEPPSAAVASLSRNCATSAVCASRFSAG